MKGTLNVSKIMLSMASLTLCTSVFAGASGNLETDPLTGFFQSTANAITMPLVGLQKSWNMNGMKDPEYLVTDSNHGKSMYLDGLDKGHEVTNQGYVNYNYDDMNGDKITDLHTQKSGIIKGVKHQGTMDVMTANGHTVRYNYVVFKVKHL
jgi:hypothetical protein